MNSWKTKFQSIIKDSAGSSNSAERGRSKHRGEVKTIVERPESPPSPSPDCNSHELDSIVTEDVVVHVHYDVKQPPPRPNTSMHQSQARNDASAEILKYQWTRFICMSDTHCNTFEVPEGDVLLHSGDLTHSGRFKHLEHTAAWLKELPHPHKIVIAGNHDLTLEKEFYLREGHRWHRKQLEDPDAVRKLMETDEGDGSFQYLEYESTTFEMNDKTWKVYGSPGSPWFGGWAFNYKRGQAAEVVASLIPDDIDILLTHGPPHRILDTTTSRVHAGCEALSPRVAQIRPKIHVFGHIHEARGAVVRYWDDQEMVTEPMDTASDKGGDTRAEATPSTLSDTETGGGGATGEKKFTVFVNAAVHYTHKHQHTLRKGTEGWHYLPIIVDIRTPC
ncbi:hypothetical protein FRC19_001598 [Serendipita sp. 401]|nr:hypothetical protein FRC19_001598 [Serendipita sp. 401]